MSPQWSGCQKQVKILMIPLILVICLTTSALAAPTAPINSALSPAAEVAAGAVAVATPSPVETSTISFDETDEINTPLSLPSRAEIKIKENVEVDDVAEKDQEEMQRIQAEDEAPTLKVTPSNDDSKKNSSYPMDGEVVGREENLNNHKDIVLPVTVGDTKLKETEPDGLFNIPKSINIVEPVTMMKSLLKDSTAIISTTSIPSSISTPPNRTSGRKLSPGYTKSIKPTRRRRTTTTTTTTTPPAAETEIGAEVEAITSFTTTSTATTTTTAAAATTTTTTTTNKLMTTPTTTILPTDPYFISGLSDLLLENNGFERISEIEAKIDKIEMNIFKNSNRRVLMTPPPSPFIPPTQLIKQTQIDDNTREDNDELSLMAIFSSVAATTGAPVAVIAAAATTAAAPTATEVINVDENKLKSELHFDEDSMMRSKTTPYNQPPVGSTVGTPAVVSMAGSTASPQANPEKEIKTMKQKNLNSQQSLQPPSQQMGKKKMTKFASGKKNKLKKIPTTTTTTTTTSTPITEMLNLEIATTDFISTNSPFPAAPSARSDDLFVDVNREFEADTPAPISTERLGSTVFATTSFPATLPSAIEASLTELHSLAPSTTFESLTPIPSLETTTVDALAMSQSTTKATTTTSESSSPMTEYAINDPSTTAFPRIPSLKEFERFLSSTAKLSTEATANPDESASSTIISNTPISTVETEWSSTILASTTDRTTTLHTPRLMDVLNTNATSYIDIDIIEDIPNTANDKEAEEKNDDIFIKVSGVGNINITTEHKKTETNGNSNESLEITLIEDEVNNPGQIIEILETTTKPNEVHTKSHVSVNHPNNVNDFSTTIQFEVPNKETSNEEFNPNKSAGGPARNGKDNYNEDEIKIKTTDKDSDTIFYISNTEVKVSESIPTPQTPNTKQNQENPDQQFFPAVFEEDVIIDIPNKNNASGSMVDDKFEADIILSPLNSNSNNYMPIKDLSYIAESFLEAEQQQQHEEEEEEEEEQYQRRHHNGRNEQNIDIISSTEISSSSDVIIQPVNIPESPLSIGVPIIAELPPQIELEEMIFSSDNVDLNEYDDNDDEYNNNDRKYIPRRKDKAFYFFNNNLIKNTLSAEEPKEKLNDTSDPNVRASASAVAIANSHKMQHQNKSGSTNGTGSTDSNVNTTAFLVENDELSENGFTDLQTLFLACFATLAPLLLSVLLAFGVRHFWRKYRRQRGLGNGILSDKSTDPLAAKSVTGSVDELKSSDSRSCLTGSNKDLEANGDIPTSGITSIGNDKSSIVNHSGTNGSIITMTMKNNHLIVETEERNDISRDTRETKMHYSPSDKDGVFVVEAARGADINDNYKANGNYEQLQQPPPNENRATTDLIASSSSAQTANGSQKVLVHNPPDGMNGDDEAVAAGSDKRPSTGLSQSDLSDSSSNDSNQNYCYGSQDIYQLETGPYDAPSPTHPRLENPDFNDTKPLIENDNSPDPDKPIITAAIYKDTQENQNTNGSFVEGGESLLSDVTALEQNQIKKDKKDKKEREDAIQEEQIRLGNGVLENGEAEETGETNNNSIIQDKCGEIIMTDPSSIIPPPVSMQLDSLSFLPAPPTSDEIKQLNELTAVLDLTQQLDSLPPPPPPNDNNNTNIITNTSSSINPNPITTTNNSIPITVNGVSES